MPEARSELTFCPRCAGTLEWRPAGDARLPHPVCAACGFVLWQNPKPAVDALILRGGGSTAELLLGRQADGIQAGLWDVPGNFLNAGDVLEEALQRECRREMDIDVEVIELVGAYEARFGDIDVIDLAYRCRLDSGEPRPADLIDDVGWFPLDRLPRIASTWLPRAIDDMRRRLG